MSNADPAKVLQEVLADPEFQGDWQSRVNVWLERALRALLRWIDQLPAAYEWALAALCVAVLAWIGYGLVTGYRELASPRAGGPTDAQKVGADEHGAADLARRAAELRALGRWREAARTLQQAVYRALAARRGVEWNPSRADWEWVQALGAELRTDLTAFTERAQSIAYDTTRAAARQSSPQSSDDAGEVAALWAQAQGWLPR